MCVSWWLYLANVGNSTVRGDSEEEEDTEEQREEEEDKECGSGSEEEDDDAGKKSQKKKKKKRIRKNIANMTDEQRLHHRKGLHIRVSNGIVGCNAYFWL